LVAPTPTRAGEDAPDNRADRRAREEPREDQHEPGQSGRVSVVAGLAPSVGNRALTRALAGSFGRLLRQDAATQPPDTAERDAQQSASSPQGAPPSLDPAVAKRLLYAQTVLSKVGQLPDGDRETLNKMAGGSDLMEVIERRDKTRADLAQAKTDLESAKDVSGAEKDAETKKAQSRIDQLGLDLEGLQTLVDQGLKKLGVASEEELVDLIGKFPEMWKKRAKEIAGKMLDENQAAVDQESQRYDYFNKADRDNKAFDDVSAIRAADKEIAANVAALVLVEFPMGGPLPPINFASIQSDVDKGPPQPPQGPDGQALPDTEEAKLAKAVYDKKVQVLARWKQLGLAHVLLFHPSYQPGYLADVSDEDIIKQTGQWAGETKAKIEKTRKNIDDESVSLWELTDVPDLTFDSLGVPRDSALGKAVEKEYADRKSDEEGLRMAAESFALTVTVVATAVAGPAGAAVGAALQGAVSVVELAHDEAKAQAQTDAQGVALDPELAKMSQEDPDLFAVVMDLVQLGLAVGDAATAAKGLRPALTALEETGDKEAFATEARKIVGSKADQLGARLQVKARAFPTDFLQVFDDYRSAHTAYMEALKADPTLEVGIWRNRDSGKYVLGYGEHGKVRGPWQQEGKLWELVKHHHPGQVAWATMTERLPSKEDFEVLMGPRIVGEDKSAVKSTITWVDEEGTMHYTTFGMDPAEKEPYWVRVADHNGQIVEKRFPSPPWSGSKGQYEYWCRTMEEAENTAIHGPPTVRPTGD
jgi:hypothetical protein